MRKGMHIGMQADGWMDGCIGERLKEVCGVEGDLSRTGEGLLNTS